MTVNELIELLSTQPGDYEVTVRTIDNDNLSIWEDAITGLAEVETTDDGMPGHVILNYEGNETGEPLDDDDEPEMTEHQREPEQEDDDNSLIEGPDGREWTWEQFQSWVISLSIRNALEMFHGGGAMDPENPDSEEGFITDRQMKALNIVIRHTVSEMVKKLSSPRENGEELYWTLTYVNDYMEPPGSDELERAYEDIKEGRFDVSIRNSCDGEGYAKPRYCQSADRCPECLENWRHTASHNRQRLPRTIERRFLHQFFHDGEAVAVRSYVGT